jgi:capsular exopolysaccharide synthesis family protein
MTIPFFKRKEDRRGRTPDPSALFKSTDHMFNEQHKNLSARFEYGVEMRGFKVVAVTSAIAGEGKTVSAVNLAANLAATGRKKVLLVDADLRKSNLAKGMQVLASPGLAEFLGGSASLKDTLRYASTEGLHVIPSGSRIAAPWGLISGERFRAFLKEVHNAYDIILLDAPPIIPVSDTLAFRDVVDGFLVVYRMGYTPHNMFHQALEEIGERKLLGVLLNGVEQHSERYYVKYYGKYYTKPAGR